MSFFSPGATAESNFRITFCWNSGRSALSSAKRSGWYAFATRNTSGQPEIAPTTSLWDFRFDVFRLTSLYPQASEQAL